MDLTNLRDSLDSSSRDRHPASASAKKGEVALTRDFKAAALQLTTLYRTSLSVSKRSYAAGYAQSLADILDVVSLRLQQPPGSFPGALRRSSPTRGSQPQYTSASSSSMTVQSDGSGSTDVDREELRWLVRYLRARIDAIRAESEDEEEEGLSGARTRTTTAAGGEEEDEGPGGMYDATPGRTTRRSAAAVAAAAAAASRSHAPPPEPVRASEPEEEAPMSAFTAPETTQHRARAATPLRTSEKRKNDAAMLSESIESAFTFAMPTSHHSVSPLTPSRKVRAASKAQHLSASSGGASAAENNAASLAVERQTKRRRGFATPAAAPIAAVDLSAAPHASSPVSASTRLSTTSNVAAGFMSPLEGEQQR